MRVVRPRPSIVLAGALAAVLGCGAEDGRGAFPGMAVYQSASGAYHFHYLSPPWFLVRTTGEAVDLVLGPASLSALADPAVVRFALHVEPRDGDYRTAAASAWSTAGGQVFANRPILRGGVEVGSELSYLDRSGNDVREAFLAGATAGHSYRMAFTGKERMDGEPMFDAMFASFAPGRDGASP